LATSSVQLKYGHSLYIRTVWIVCSATDDTSLANTQFTHFKLKHDVCSCLREPIRGHKIKSIICEDRI